MSEWQAKQSSIDHGNWVSNDSALQTGDRHRRFFSFLMVLLMGTLAAIAGSCGASSPVKSAADVGRSGRFKFEGYLPRVLPSGYSLIGQRPWLQTLDVKGQFAIVGANHPDGSIGQITTIHEWPFPDWKQDDLWLGFGDRSRSTYSERMVGGYRSLVQEEFETSEMRKRFRTSIALDVPSCREGLLIESPGVLEPEAAILMVPEIACRGNVMSVFPSAGREVLMTSRLSDAHGPTLIFDNEDHSGRFSFSVTYRTMPSALGEALRRLSPTQPSAEEPVAVPVRFAGHSTIITPGIDGSWTSYKWQEGTVSFELVTTDSAEGLATEFIEAIRPIEQDVYIEMLKTLSSEPPPHLQSYVPEPTDDPYYPEPPEPTIG
jgi:hypothetical protein